MKSRKEFENIVFEKSRILMDKRKAARRRAVKICAPMAACILVACMVLYPRPMPGKTAQGERYGNSGSGKNGSYTGGAPEGACSVKINTIDGMPNKGTNNIALMLDDFTKLDAEGLSEYYGIDINSIGGLVQAGFKLEEQGHWGVYRRKTGEAYWDVNTVTFTDGNRRASITLAKGGLPHFDINTAYEHPLEETSINGCSAVLAEYYEAGACYYGQLVYKNTGYIINTAGIEEDCFIRMLENITG